MPSNQGKDVQGGGGGIGVHGCRQAGRSAFISYGAHENTAGSMVHAVLVDYKSKISRGHT